MKLCDSDGSVEKSFKFKVDPSKSPAWLDLIENKDTSPGIYKLDGDSWQLCLTEGDKRPTEVAAGTNVTFIVLKRQK